MSNNVTLEQEVRIAALADVIELQLDDDAKYTMSEYTANPRWLDNDEGDECDRWMAGRYGYRDGATFVFDGSEIKASKEIAKARAEIRKEDREEEKALAWDEFEANVTGDYWLDLMGATEATPRNAIVEGYVDFPWRVDCTNHMKRSVGY